MHMEEDGDSLRPNYINFVQALRLEGLLHLITYASFWTLVFNSRICLKERVYVA